MVGAWPLSGFALVLRRTVRWRLCQHSTGSRVHTNWTRITVKRLRRVRSLITSNGISAQLWHKPCVIDETRAGFWLLSYQECILHYRFVNAFSHIVSCLRFAWCALNIRLHPSNSAGSDRVIKHCAIALVDIKRASSGLLTPLPSEPAIFFFR